MADDIEEDDDYEGLLEKNRHEPKSPKSGLMNSRITDKHADTYSTKMDDVELDENGKVKEKDESEEEEEEAPKPLFSDQSVSKTLAIMNILFALLLIIPTVIASPDLTYEVISLYVVAILMLFGSTFGCIWYFCFWMPVEDFQYEINQRAESKRKKRRSIEIRAMWDGDGSAPEAWVRNPPDWVNRKLAIKELEELIARGADIDLEEDLDKMMDNVSSRTNIVIGDDGEEIIEEEDSYETSDIHSEESSIGPLDPDNEAGGEEDSDMDAPPPFQGEGVEMTSVKRLESPR